MGVFLAFDPNETAACNDLGTNSHSQAMVLGTAAHRVKNIGLGSIYRRTRAQTNPGREDGVSLLVAA